MEAASGRTKTLAGVLGKMDQEQGLLETRGAVSLHVGAAQGLG